MPTRVSPWPICRALAVTAALSAVACSGSAGAPAGRGGAGRAVVVRVGSVQTQDVAYDIKALGTLEAEELVQVTAEVEGAVADVGFHEGDRVGTGTILVRIDPARYRLEFQRAEAAFNRAQAEAHRARSDLDRREALARENLVAPEELERARTELERLAAEAAGARAAREIARQNVRRSEVRAPRAGSINTRTVETGQFVRTGTVLATLVDTARLRLRFKVSEAESLRARTGQDLTFRVSALGEQPFKATVYHVGSVADPATRQVEVMAWVKNPGQLKPGFFAEVALASETRAGALVVPEAAVQASERGFVVYAVEDGKARSRPIQVGLRTGTGLVEVVSGLKGGETVVIEGSDRLADGVPVQPAAAPAARPASAGGGGGPAAAPTGGNR
ncbi:MAG TPA: efflux RND transporter periplasmic adaptor subunit [Vicinamibacteria bacterium]|nr:efflux RND transporter periplasmic adaptor subunit [Vicinamibacteria bacterium]